MRKNQIGHAEFWKKSPYTVEKAAEECLLVDGQLKELLKNMGMPLDDISLVKIGYGIDGHYQYCFTLNFSNKISGRFGLNDALKGIALHFLHHYEKKVLRSDDD